MQKINIFYLEKLLKKYGFICNEVEDSAYLQIWYFDKFNIKFNTYDKKAFVNFNSRIVNMECEYTLLFSPKIIKATKLFAESIFWRARGYN